jgi:hypothetical protein
VALRVRQAGLRVRVRQRVRVALTVPMRAGGAVVAAHPLPEHLDQVAEPQDTGEPGHVEIIAYCHPATSPAIATPSPDLGGFPIPPG